MKILSHFPRNINPPALIVGCLIVFVAMTISEMIKQGQTDRTRNLVETYADELSARIEEQLKTRIAIVSLIRDYWQSDVVVSPKHFKTITEAATTSFNDVQALNWVNTDGVIIAVTPLEGNEDALTLDINDFEQPARALELSRTTNSLQITPPIRLAQGGNGFVGYAPVVKGTTLMGYISIVFRSDVLLNEIRQGRNDFTLRIEDDGKLLYGQELFEFSDLATARSINVVGRTWDVKVEPNETIVKEAQSIIDELIIIISFIVSMGMVLALNQAHQNRQKLKEREERFSLAIEGASDGLFDVNVETGSVYYSPRWFRLLGYEPGELPVNAREFYNRIHPDDVAHVPTLEQLSKLDTTQNDTEFRMRHKNGTWIHILSRAKLINKNGKIIRMVGTHVDVTDLRKEQEKLKIAAITDPLTGLRNRAGIEDHLAQISKTLNKNENICVLHIDLDGFKSINDRYGYEYGDKTLKIVAERLNEFFADLGLVARIGGDEFLTIWTTAPSEIDIS